MASSDASPRRLRAVFPRWYPGGDTATAGATVREREAETPATWTAERGLPGIQPSASAQGPGPGSPLGGPGPGPESTVALLLLDRRRPPHAATARGWDYGELESIAMALPLPSAVVCLAARILDEWQACLAAPPAPDCLRIVAAAQIAAKLEMRSPPVAREALDARARACTDSPLDLAAAEKAVLRALGYNAWFPNPVFFLALWGGGVHRLARRDSEYTVMLNSALPPWGILASDAAAAALAVVLVDPRDLMPQARRMADMVVAHECGGTCLACCRYRGSLRRLRARLGAAPGPRSQACAPVPEAAACNV